MSTIDSTILLAFLMLTFSPIFIFFAVPFMYETALKYVVLTIFLMSDVSSSLIFGGGPTLIDSIWAMPFKRVSKGLSEKVEDINASRKSRISSVVNGLFITILPSERLLNSLIRKLKFRRYSMEYLTLVSFI